MIVVLCGDCGCDRSSIVIMILCCDCDYDYDCDRSGVVL